MSKESEYTELLPQMVYNVALKVVVAIPEITPLPGLSTMSEGKSG